MTDEIFFDGVRYISAAEAAGVSNLTRDYVARLGREGKIVGKQIGRQWYVSQESLRTFLVGQEYSNALRQKALVRERQQEYGRTQAPVVPPQTLSQTAVPAAVAAIPALQNELHKKLATAVAHTSARAVSKATALAGNASAQMPLYVVTPGFELLHKVAAAVLAVTLVVGVYSAGNSLIATSPDLATGTVVTPSVELGAAAGLVGGTFSDIAQGIENGIDEFFAPFFGVHLATGNGAGGFVSVQIAQSPTKPGPLAPIVVSARPAQTISQTIIQNPVVERVVDSERVIASGGITRDELNQRLQELDNKLSEQMFSLSSANSTAIAQNYNVTAQTNAIDMLTNTTITNPSITGGSISGADISGATITGADISGATFSGTTTLDALAVTGSATSTFESGIDIASGCFSVAGTCITAGGGGAGNPGGSNMEVQFNDGGVFNGTSALTFDKSTGTLSVANLDASSTVTGNLTAGNATTTNATTTNLYVSGTASLANPLAISSGGTGTSSAPSYGQVLLGNSSGGYDLVSTSSLGIVGGGGGGPVAWGSITGTLSSQSDLQSALNAKLSLSDWYATTTNALAEGSNNLYFTTGRVQSYLDTLGKGYFFATSSASYFLSQNQSGAFSTSSASYFLGQNQNLAFSTSSASYFLAQNAGAAFATTSSDFWLSTKTTSNLAEGTNLYYTDARVNSFVAASTTIPKTYANNTFTGNNTFTNATTTDLFSTTASSTNLFSQTASFGSLNLINALPVASGGTNATSFTTGALVAFDGTRFVSTSTIGNGELQNSALSVSAGSGLSGGGSISLGGTTSLSLNLANANSWTGLQQFANSSSTLATLGTTWFSGVTSSLLKTDTNGKLVAAVAGTDYEVPLTFSSGLNRSGNTITNTGVTSNVAGTGISVSGATGAVTITNTGVLSVAGTANQITANTSSGVVTLSLPNLLILPTASTTNFSNLGEAYFGSTATSTFDSAGDLSVAGTLNATGKTTLGNASTSVLSVSGNSYIGTSHASALSLGSVISCTGGQALQTDGSGNISCGVIATGGASSGGGWTESNDHVGLSTTTDLVAIGASSTPYAKFAVLSGSAATTTLALVPANSQTANIIDIYNTSGGLGSVLTAGGNLGLGTTSPGSLLSLGGIANFTTATSTFYGSGGINLASGCFSINGTCVGAGAGSVTSITAGTGLTGGTITNSGTIALDLTNANSWTGLQQFTNSSSTLATLGTTWFSGNTSTLLSTDANGKVQNTTVSGPLSFSGSTLSLGTVGIANGGTNATSFTSGAPIAFDGTRLVSSSTLSVVYGGTGSTTLSGLLKGNGTSGIQSAIAGIDYQAPITGSTGQIAYFSGTNTPVGTSSIFISSNGNIGIGTTTPPATFTITGPDIASNQRTFAVYGQNNPAGAAGEGSGIYLASGNGGSSGFSSMFPGGTGGNLELYGGAGGAQSIGSRGGNGGSVFIAGGPAGSGTTPGSAGSVILGENGSTGAVGNVGIATSTPGSLFSINGIANFAAATSTFYSTGGINLTTGCFAVGGNCLTLGSFSGTLGIANGGTNATSFTTGQLLAFDGTRFVSTSTIGNGQLANSTIALSSSGSITVGSSPISLGGTGTLNLNLANANNWTGLQTFVNASSTNFSNFGTAYFGGTATSSFNSSGILNLADQGQSSSTIITLGGRQLLNASSSPSVGNLFLGLDSGSQITNGTVNSGFGYQALQNATTTTRNTAVGYKALQGSTATFSGVSNTGLGYQVLEQISSGSNNTAVGDSALGFNSSGSNNTAVGSSALFNGGTSNTAIGYNALYNNGSAASNTAIGYEAGMGQDVFSPCCTFSGFTNDTLLGYQTGFLTTSGSNNLLLGYNAGYDLTSGSSNVALGYNIDLPSNTGNQQLNIGNVLYGSGLYNGSTVSAAPVSGGTIGIGTSTPWAELSVAGSSNGSIPILSISTSTASATSTVFAIDKNGNTTIGNNGSVLTINGATTTAANGINLTTGCFAIGGNCLTLGSFSGTLTVPNGGTGATSLTGILKGNGTSAFTAAVAGTDFVAPATTITAGAGLTGGGDLSTNRTISLDLTHANNWTGLQTFQNASSSQFSVFTKAYFGGSATTTIDSAGNVAVAGTLNVTGNTTLGNATSTTFFSTTASSTNLFAQTASVATLGASGSFTLGGSLIANNSTGFLNRLVVGTGVFGQGPGSPGGPLTLQGGTGFNPGDKGGSVYILGGLGNGASNGNVLLGTDSSGNQVGNIGIGTSTPFAKFSLAGAAGGTTPILSISTSTSGFATSTIFSIDQNGNTTIGNNGSVLTINGATTTAANGINLTTGCFAVGGNCLTLGSFSGTLGIANGGTNATSFTTGAPIAFDGTRFVSSSTLSVAYGGTGATTLTSGQLLLGNGAAAVSSVARGSLNVNAGLTISNNANVLVGQTATISLDLTNPNSWTGLQQFNNASTTLFSSYGPAYFGASATSSFNTAGVLSLVGNGLSVGTNQLVVSGGNVGIGTTSPYALLSLSANSGNTNTTLFAIASSTPTSTSTLLSFSNTGGLTIGPNISPVSSSAQLSILAGTTTMSMASTASSGLNTPSAVYIQGRYAYVVSQDGVTNSSVTIFDVSNPASPTKIGSVSTGLQNPDSIYVQGRYAYVGSLSNFALVVFDVSNPAAPFKTGSVSLSSFPNHVYVQGRYAYVTTSVTNPSLTTVDISNPASPVKVSSISIGLSTPSGLYVSGRYAYVTDSTNGLITFDISNPTSPTEVGSTATGLSTPNGVYVSGRYAYVTDSTNGLITFDISNPTSPTEVGSTASGLSTAESVSVQGRYAYVGSNGNNSLVTFDISNPASLVKVATISSGLSGPQGIYVSGRYAYVASNTNNSLVTFDLGGAYIQSLEAGALEAGTLSLRNNLSAVDGSFSGGLTVGNNFNVAGSFGLTASTFNATTTAGQNYSIFSLNTASSSSPLFTTLYNGNVGIGTSTPGANFSISGTTGENLFQIATSTNQSIFTVDQNGNITVAGALSVTGNTTLTNATTTSLFSTTASSTNLFAQTASLGSLSLVNALSVPNGGTGATSLTGLVKGNGTSAFTAAVAGTDFVAPATTITAGAGLTGGGDLSTSRTISLDLTHANNWTGLQTFTNSSSTLATLGTAWFTGNTGALLSTDANGKLQNTTVSYPLQFSGSTLSTAFGTTTTNTFSQLQTFTSGLISNSSSTVAGNFNTTGTSYFGGNVGIGATSPGSLLSINGGDITQTASNPTLASSTNTTNGVNAVAVVGRYAYLAENNTTGGLQIYDVSNPNAPVSISSFNTAVTPYGIVVSGKYAYIVGKQTSLTTDKVQVIDVSNPSAPVSVGTSGTISAFSNSDAQQVPIALSGHYIYTGVPNAAATMRVVDVSNPASPVLVGTGNISTNDGNDHKIRGIYVSGNYAYVTLASVGSTGNKLYIFDISNPVAPVQVGLYTTTNAPSKVYVSGKYAYIAEEGTTGGLEIVDISNPTSPVSVGSFTSANSVYSLQVAGKYAYLGENGTTNGVEVVDVSAPAAPVKVGSFTLANALNDAANMYISGKYAYVPESSATNGLQILDLSGASLPTASIGNLNTSDLNVDNNASFGGDLYAGGGINTGLSGIFSRGTISSFVASTTQTNPISASFMGGNVVINNATSSPYAALTVSGNTVNNATLALLPVSSQVADIFDVFNTSGNLASVINASGNWGIGTTSPGSLLSVGGIANFTTATSTFYGSGGINLTSGCFSIAGTCVGGSSGSGTVNSGTQGQFAFYAANGTTISGTSTLFATTAGDIGIGTTTPGLVSGASRYLTLATTGVNPSFSSLELSGYDSNVSNSTIGRIDFFNAANVTDLARISSAINNDVGQGALVFSTNAGSGLAEVARIISTGNFGLGTSTPGANLTVNGTTGQNLLQVATSTNQNILTVNQNGFVGINTATGVDNLDIVNTSSGTSANAGFGLLAAPVIGNVSDTAFTINAATSTFSPSGVFSKSAASITNITLNAAKGNFSLSGITLGNLVTGGRDLVTANANIFSLTGSPTFNDTSGASGGSTLNNLFANGINASVSLTPVNTAGLKNRLFSAAGNFSEGSTETGLVGATTYGIEAANNSNLESPNSIAYGGFFSNNATASTTYGIFASNNSSATGNTAYGLYLSGPGTTNSNDYSLYSAGNAPSYFAGNVGVGTTTPWGRLAVSTAIQQDGGIPLLNVASTTGASLFTVLGNGNVGVGTSTPIYPLQVYNPSTHLQLLATEPQETGSAWSTFGGSQPAVVVGQDNIGNANPTQLVFGEFENSGSGRPEFVFNGVKDWMGLGQADTGSDTNLRLGVVSKLGTDWSTFGSGDQVNLSVDGSLAVGTSTIGPSKGIVVSGSVGIGTTTPGSILSIGSLANFTTATSTFYSSGGINLTSGCFSIGGNCVGASGGSGTVTSIVAGTGLTGGTITTSGTIALDLTHANSWTGLQTFQNASSTNFSVFGTAFFGGSATSSFNSAGALTLAGLTNSLLYTNGSNQVAAVSVSSPLSFSSGTLSLNTVGVGTGGTGATSLTGLLQGNGTSPITGVTGTAGQFVYFNGTNTVTATSTLFLTTAGNIGLGTTTPINKLSINGGIDLEGAAVAPANDPGLFMGYNASLNTANIEAINQLVAWKALQIDGGTLELNSLSGGNVGIGTTTPGTKLDIYNTSSGATSDIAYFSNGASATSTAERIDFRAVDITGNGTTTSAITSILQKNYVSGQGDLVFSVLNAGALTEAMRIANTGRVGIGSTTPNTTLAVSQTVSTPQFSIAYDNSHDTEMRVDSAGGLNVHASGNQDYFVNDNLWVCTGGTITASACPTGNPTGQGNLVVANKAGIGTSTPASLLDIYGSAPSIRLEDSGTAGNVALFQANASTGPTLESLTDGSGNSTSNSVATQITFNTTGFAVGTSPATAVGSARTFSNQLTLGTSGNLLLGTSTAQVTGETVQNKLFVANGYPSAMGLATSTIIGDLKVTGKLDVPTIDPVYTIGGTKYATYGESSTGEHEETLQTIELTQKDPATGKYVYPIHFDTLDEGSDLWLFYQITDFGDNWQNLVVELTPGFDGTVFYQKEPGTDTLLVESDAPGEVSMRLSGDRFDYSKWGNVRPDQNDTSYPGFVLPIKDDSQAAAAASAATAEQ